ncbi:class I SAM-dependent methyltransferase [Amycolatopsis suaedae]|uniref:Methyltransferase domain-containing protein n=1 Tax=Amycolatopsis suaedae TaxID=2510978 RepID=A0A4Q7JCW0_9PSEU|nr:class I SAM-dependent methyltransferase [Amycolatopsis suaedae]RZQ65741.1 methyltransferase domain-containing protein [Amycolatopsis suaedae]
MIHENPLAYVLGMQGAALLRAFTGEYDRAFTEARIAEIRALLDDERFAGAAVDVERVGTVDGYRVWSRTYDDEDNGAFDFDQPAVTAILDTLPAGVALDAACGTGRYAALLAERGHDVIGVDSSPDMLERAERRVPSGRFRAGDLHRLPVGDGEVDLVVCGLALAHVPDLGPPMAEFARVLRPGGHLVIADMHPESIARGSVPTVRDDTGRPGRVACHRHRMGDYLRAALAADLRLLRCEEPVLPVPDPLPPAADTLGPWEAWPWSLAAVVPEAAAAATSGSPVTVIWQFQLRE